MFTFLNMFFFCSDVNISVSMLLAKRKWRWHTEKILKCQVRIEKNLFQDDDMFGMRQLKGLKLSIIWKYINILPAKFDWKWSRTKLDGFSPEPFGDVSKTAILSRCDPVLGVRAEAFHHSSLQLLLQH